MNYTSIQQQIKKTLSSLGTSLQLQNLDTQRKVSFIGVFGKDEEVELEDTNNTSAMIITRTRVLYVPGDISLEPVVGDLIIDKSKKITSLSNDNVGGSSYSYKVIKVEKYIPEGKINCAFKLTIAG